MMTNQPPGGRTTFQLICSATAAAELSREECLEFVREVIPMARQLDRGVHEGLAFAFDLHGKEWHIVVDLAEGWVKILTTDEFEEGIREGLRKN
jgi:hypothetical protein